MSAQIVVKKIPSRKIVKLLDKETSLLVRSVGVCAASDLGSCGGPLQDAHIIGRANHTLRWDLMNHLCLCMRHHLYFWHHDPFNAIEWFQKKYPERWIYLLEARKLTIKRSSSDLQELLNHIRNKDIKATYVLTP